MSGMPLAPLQVKIGWNDNPRTEDTTLAYKILADVNVTQNLAKKTRMNAAGASTNEIGWSNTSCAFHALTCPLESGRAI